MDSIAGFILTGGQSRRMGTDKSRLMLEGRSFVERIAAEPVRRHTFSNSCWQQPDR